MLAMYFPEHVPPRLGDLDKRIRFHGYFLVEWYMWSSENFKCMTQPIKYTTIGELAVLFGAHRSTTLHWRSRNVRGRCLAGSTPNVEVNWE